MKNTFSLSPESATIPNLNALTGSNIGEALWTSAIHAEYPSLMTPASGRESFGRTRGRVITFYSYKGGVGRSRALANVAFLMASRGKSVLCLDFDLEAPGLADYFEGEAFTWEKPGHESHIGLMDLFCSYRDNLLSRIPRRGLQAVDAVQRIKINRLGGEIAFLGPGRQDRDYKQSVCSFDWRSFYERWGGGSYVDEMRREFTARYDYVLVDSRTGFTDISGFCTVHLPDVVVAVFTPGPQSQKGLVDALECIEANRKVLQPKEPFHIVPLPCRVDHSVARAAFGREAYDRWRGQLLDSYFARKVVELGLGLHPAEYFSRAAIEYDPMFVYVDTIESLVHDIADPAGNAGRYLHLIRVLDALRPFELSAAGLGLDERTVITLYTRLSSHDLVEEVLR